MVLTKPGDMCGRAASWSPEGRLQGRALWAAACLLVFLVPMFGARKHDGKRIVISLR